VVKQTSKCSGATHCPAEPKGGARRPGGVCTTRPELRDRGAALRPTAPHMHAKRAVEQP
jgi:hypothetical protein